MSQPKKNIILAVTWIVLVLATILAANLQQDDNRIDVAKDIFSVNDVAAIDKVTLTGVAEKNTLSFANGTWMLNATYKADPQRVTVLFAILKQNKIRRKAANSLAEKLDSLLATDGISVRFMTGNQLTKAFIVVGFDGLTYFNDGKESYVVEIPGYRVDLAGIFKLNEGGWRNPLVFDINWANLQKVEMIFPERPNEQFEVVYKRRYYTINDMLEVDSTKLTNFLDDVSLLYANDYLKKNDLKSYRSDTLNPKATIVISDVGNNQHSLTIYNELPESDLVLGLIDSTDYATFDFNMIRKVLRPKKYFKAK
ncbi:MAG: DUF4340 domain-containing protein [Bacteroidota bacterium]